MRLTLDSLTMTSEIVKILNSGYQKGMPVLRSEGKGTFEVKAYDVSAQRLWLLVRHFLIKLLRVDSW